MSLHEGPAQQHYLLMFTPDIEIEGGYHPGLCCELGLMYLPAGLRSTCSCLQSVGRMSLLETSPFTFAAWHNNFRGPPRTLLLVAEGRAVCVQDHGLETGLDKTLIPRCAPALPFGNAKPVPVYIEAEAINTQRAIGTTLSHEVKTASHAPCPPSPDLAEWKACTLLMCH